MIRAGALGSVAVLAITACAYIGGAPSVPPPRGDSPTPTPTPTPTPSGQSTPTPTRATEAGTIPLCEDVPAAEAPAEWYRDSPIYVANEQPTERLQRWANGKPGFEMLWIDREHNGWVALAFSRDAEARQRELEAEFPDVGVVAVPVDWTRDELEALQQRVVDELMPDIASSAGSGTNKGVVSIGVGVLTPERIAAVETRFAGEHVCLEGMDPANAPKEGPQPQAGDGWRLLVDKDEFGQTYRTGIAYDEASYAALWDEIGLWSERPAVDFQQEVVIWFGAVHGSSCPRIRLDDVLVDRERALVYADIVDLDVAGVCTSDAIPHAYLVALERAKLPRGRFAIQLDADGPPGGVPEERTIVEVDLSEPGSVARSGDVHPDDSEPEPYTVGPGDIIEPGFETRYRQSVHCGLEWLGPLNDVNFRTSEADGVDWLPAPWRDAVVDGQIVLEVLLTTDPPRLEATANGRTVVYEATGVEPPGCD